MDLLRQRPDSAHQLRCATHDHQQEPDPLTRRVRAGVSHAAVASLVFQCPTAGVCRSKTRNALKLSKTRVMWQIDSAFVQVTWGAFHSTGSLRSVHCSLLLEHGLSFEVDFTDFLWSDVSMFPYSLCRLQCPSNWTCLFLSMAKYPVKSTSQSTYGRMERTSELSFGDFHWLTSSHMVYFRPGECRNQDKKENNNTWKC